jgi:hypothetical protein
MPAQNVPFTVTKSEITVVEVTLVDGRRFQLDLRLALLQIRDMGISLPNGMPSFEVQATLLMESKALSPPTGGA